jgi:U3 small nucleolar RNA-associated protein 14
VANKAPRKENEILLSKDSNALTKSKNKLKKQAKKRTEDKDKAKDDAEVEISMDTILAVPSEPTAPSLPTKKSKAKASETQDVPMRDGGTADDDSDANSEVEAQEKMLNVKGKASKKTLMAFEQRDLVALAFAGDNVVHVGFWFLGVKSQFIFRL